MGCELLVVGFFGVVGLGVGWELDIHIGSSPSTTLLCPGHAEKLHNICNNISPSTSSQAILAYFYFVNLFFEIVFDLIQLLHSNVGTT